VRVLIDTHVFLWASRSPRKLSPAVGRLLADQATEVAVSSVVPWELSIKWRLGKLPDAGPILDAWDECMTGLEADALPITHRHAVLAGRLDWPHADPFDRMLAAQAIEESLPLISADHAFATLPDVRVWWDVADV